MRLREYMVVFKTPPGYEIPYIEKEFMAESRQGALELAFTNILMFWRGELPKIAHVYPIN